VLGVHSPWDFDTFSYQSRHVCTTPRMADKVNPQ
jgi:hypothetical protein